MSACRHQNTFRFFGSANQASHSSSATFSSPAGSDSSSDMKAPGPTTSTCRRWMRDASPRSAVTTFQPSDWSHLRTTNPTVELRTYRTKGPGSREAGLAMAFKLARKAESRWRKLNGSERLQDLIDGIVFVDGERIAA